MTECCATIRPDRECVRGRLYDDEPRKPRPLCSCPCHKKETR